MHVGRYNRALNVMTRTLIVGKNDGKTKKVGCNDPERLTFNFVDIMIISD